jgi:hypothetical protein
LPVIEYFYASDTITCTYITQLAGKSPPIWWLLLVFRAYQLSASIAAKGQRMCANEK